MTTRRRGRRLAALIVLAALAACAALAAVVACLNVRGEWAEPAGGGRPGIGGADGGAGPGTAALVERGAYLARAGNCLGCHTAAGAPAYAGGRAVETPFGAVMAPNLTPDPETGLGHWSASDFWRALHHGRSRDGRLLYPAFPYPSFTVVTRADSDALHAYLRSLPPVRRANEPHALRFPYGTQAALAVWRALYFRPATFEPDSARSPAWNRGKYLVQGLGHCAACHSARDALGGAVKARPLEGAEMPGGGWYAPSLASPAEAGVQSWSRADVVRLLKTGVAPGASVSGPMAEVVFQSTQHLTEPDLQAMAEYLVTWPRHDVPATPVEPARPEVMKQGRRVYEQHCASCHGASGRGVTGIYPALAGNRAVVLEHAGNVVEMLRHGGFAPTTAGNPRPFGMPPYGQTLSDEELAAVATFIRQSWGNRGRSVSSLEVLRQGR